MLRARVLSAAIVVPLVLLLIYLGGLPWLAAIGGAGVLGWREMTRVLQRDHFAVDRLLGLAFVIASLVAAYLRSTGLVQLDLLPFLLTALLILSLISALYDKSEQPTIGWAMNVAGALYLGFLLSYFILLRQRPSGLQWTVIAIALTWIYDAGAYFVGSAIGRHKLWPRISPKKTWEGLIGGTVITLIAGALLAPWLLDLDLWTGVLLGAVVATVAPFGDFSVSLFKRMARIKDTSALIPGHGGVLDRLDSLLFAIPIVTFFAMFVR